MAQGTIKDWDEETRTGSLLMEDRTEVAIDADVDRGVGHPHVAAGPAGSVRSRPKPTAGRASPGR